ncbi:unnamed protein product, partial [Choristocarpus tenellus]
MSTRRGSGGGSKKPAHQNKFAFRHNPKSKKTLKILAMPNEGLCPSCHDKVEWRKKYRKYRPLRQPATCNDCHQKTVTAAYHKICATCARTRRVCPWCCTKGQRRPPKQSDDTENVAAVGGEEKEGSSTAGEEVGIEEMEEDNG